MSTRIRTLRIGATEFKWTAELHDPLSVRLRVWGGGKNGVHAARGPHLFGRCGPAVGDVPDIANPTPSVVRAIIEYALDHGWEPASVGGRYDIESGAELEIPGFHFTDQL